MGLFLVGFPLSVRGSGAIEKGVSMLDYILFRESNLYIDHNSVHVKHVTYTRNALKIGIKVFVHAKHVTYTRNALKLGIKAKKKKPLNLVCIQNKF